MASGAWFNGLDYIAGCDDLINALWVDDHGGAAHYITSGRTEGRSVRVDGLEYLARYDDLSAFLPHTRDAGAEHFIRAGHGEGRRESFDD